MVTAMNRFTELEAHCARSGVELLKAYVQVAVTQYAEPQDQDAAAVALLQLVTELLQQEK